jgi:hypothetical protein
MSLVLLLSLLVEVLKNFIYLLHIFFVELSGITQQTSHLMVRFGNIVILFLYFLVHLLYLQTMLFQQYNGLV